VIPHDFFLFSQRTANGWLRSFCANSDEEFHIHRIIAKLYLLGKPANVYETLTNYFKFHVQFYFDLWDSCDEVVLSTFVPKCEGSAWKDSTKSLPYFLCEKMSELLEDDHDFSVSIAESRGPSFDFGCLDDLNANTMKIRADARVKERPQRVCVKYVFQKIFVTSEYAQAIRRHLVTKMDERYPFLFGAEGTITPVRQQHVRCTCRSFGDLWSVDSFERIEDQKSVSFDASSRVLFCDVGTDENNRHRKAAGMPLILRGRLNWWKRRMPFPPGRYEEIKQSKCSDKLARWIQECSVRSNENVCSALHFDKLDIMLSCSIWTSLVQITRQLPRTYPERRRKRQPRRRGRQRRQRGLTENLPRTYRGLAEGDEV